MYNSGLQRESIRLTDGDLQDKEDIHSILDNPLQRLASPVVDLTPEKSSLMAFRTYTELIEGYTPRRLTHQKDILRAIVGLLHQVEQQLGLCCWGIPMEHLDSALLWRANDDYQSAMETQTFEKRIVLAQDLQHEAQQFPSWSWAGWITPVRYEWMNCDPSQLYSRIVLADNPSIPGVPLSYRDPARRVTIASPAPPLTERHWV